MRIFQRVGLLPIVAFAASLSAPSGLAQAPSDTSKRRVADRTNPALERMTPAQREHARIFRDISNSKSKLLDEQVSVTVTLDFIGSTPTKTFATHLRELICSSDVAFVGEVISAQSFPTEEGSFLFSEYAVSPKETLRQRSISLTSPVTLIRPGGAIVVDGVRVTAEINTFPSLVVGRTYLFFGEVLQRTAAVNSTETYELLGQSVRPLQYLNVVWSTLLDAASAVDLVRTHSCR